MQMISKRWRAILHDLGSSRRLIQFFFPQLKPFRYRIVVVIVFGALTTFAGALLPLITKFIIDNILVRKDLQLFFLFIALYLGFFIGMQAVAAVSAYMSMYVSSLFSYRLSTKYLNHMASLSIPTFNKKSTGQHIFGLTNDVSGVTDAITSAMPGAFHAIWTLGIALTVLFTLQWWATLLFLVFIPTTALFRLAYSSILKGFQANLRSIGERLNGNLVEAVSLMTLAKTFGRQSHVVHTYVRDKKEMIRLSFRLWRIRTLLDQAGWLLSSGPSTLVTCIIWYWVIMDRMTLGSAVAFSMYLGMILPPFVELVGLFQKAISATVPGDRLLEFLETPREPRGTCNSLVSLGRLEDLSFESVSFSYSNDTNVLDGVTFTVPRGSICVLMGPNGCGKTTLLRLLCAHEEGYSGTITINGRSLRDMHPHTIRQIVTLMPQETQVISGTLRENVLFGRPDASELDLIRAAESACLDSVVKELPLGFDSYISSEHTALSVGQKQRIGLARTILAGSGILLLDEPYSGIDRKTEAVLWAKLAQMKTNRIILIVTHREPPPMYVDVMVHLEQGRSRVVYPANGAMTCKTLTRP